MSMCRDTPARATQGDILEDIALIENLEETKRTALEIADKVVQAKETGISLSQAREVRAPRPAPLLPGSSVHCSCASSLTGVPAGGGALRAAVLPHRRAERAGPRLPLLHGQLCAGAQERRAGSAYVKGLC